MIKALPTQDTRPIAVFSPFGTDQLLLRRFFGREVLSQMFEYELDALSLDDRLDPAQILGHNISWRIDRGLEPQYFNGDVTEFANVGKDDRFSIYRIKVSPRLWFLTQTVDSRIFQNKTTPEIIKTIFQDLNFDWVDFRLTGSYQPRTYCVQYRETDFDFVSRLMEEDGIFYYFQHQNGKHLMVLCDDSSGYFDLPDDQVEFPKPDGIDDTIFQINSWEHRYALRSGRYSHRDFNFEMPRQKLETKSKSIVKFPVNQSLEFYDYPGRHSSIDDSGRRARIRIEELEADHDVVNGASTYCSFSPGGKFNVRDHRIKSEIGKTYVLTETRIQASVHGSYVTGTETNELDYSNRFQCIPSETSFRAPSRTVKPVVDGPQTAIVVGPAGEEIYTDEYGRVKVQFHWDREGNYDETSSCWVRVSQAHAGNGWGSIDIPRIGEEVIVKFLDGNPDRPIIKGRVYNAEATTPFALPGSMTRSGLKSDTHKGSGYNEVTMDDTAGQEQLRVNAQYNMDTTIGNNQTLAVGVDRTDQIGNNDTLTIGVDSLTQIGNNATRIVGNNETETVANNIVIESGTSITLACGASTIHMNQAGVITISGQFVTSAARASNSTLAPLTQVAGGNMLTQAGLIALRLGGICHVSGGTTSYTGGTVNVKARGGPVVVKGAPIKIGDAGARIVKINAPGVGNSSTTPPGGISEQIALELSGHAYDETLQAGQELPPLSDGSIWKVLDQGVRREDDGFKAIAVQGPDGQVVIAFGGTDLTSAKDWYANAVQFAGGIPSQYEHALDFTRKIQAKYGDVVLTGHSLGGGMANYAGGMTGLPGVGFNSATLGRGTRADIRRNGPPRSTDGFVHYNNDEIVSNLPGVQMGTVATHVNDEGFVLGHLRRAIDTTDPLIADGPLADEVLRDHYQRIANQSAGI